MNFFNLNFKLDNSQADVQSSELQLQIRAINILNILRFFLSLVFISIYILLGNGDWADKDSLSLFFNLSVAYFLFSITALLISPLMAASHRFAFPLQVVIDILFIILLMHTAGGIQSGFGLLLIIIIVTASLISNGRLALFYASVATVSLLLEQSYQILLGGLSASSYTQAVMLSISCFSIGSLAHILAKRMLRSEALASARGIDVANLSQVNALITKEMHDGVMVIDENSHIRHRNLQADTLLSLPKNTKGYADIKSNSPEVAAIYSRWLAGEDTSNNSVITISNRELKLIFMPINQARQMGAVIFIQDFSQLQAKAQQVKLAALGRLTANIAHEIRNPLSAISHANQLLQEESGFKSPSTTRILQIIEDNIIRLDQIVKDVLELNRRDRTKQEEFDLNEFLSDFYTQFCAVEKVPTSHFQFKPLLQKQAVAFDKRHLTQILWNLSKNGWEHSQQKIGSLTLNCAEVGKLAVNVQIADDGSGVAEADRARLFEPFFTTKITGNGLGLYISRELAEANGAGLEYQAKTLGSTFIVRLKKVR